MMKDAFAKAIKAKTEDKTLDARIAIQFAKGEARTDSANAFIDSCEEQLDEKGFLTQKQIDALYEIDSGVEDYPQRGW